jgi:hypothetical protein
MVFYAGVFSLGSEHGDRQLSILIGVAAISTVMPHELFNVGVPGNAGVYGRAGIVRSPARRELVRIRDALEVGFPFGIGQKAAHVECTAHAIKSAVQRGTVSACSNSATSDGR